MSTPPLPPMAGILTEYLGGRRTATPGGEFRAGDIAQAREAWKVSVAEVGMSFREIGRRLPGQASLGPASAVGRCYAVAARRAAGILRDLRLSAVCGK